MKLPVTALSGNRCDQRNAHVRAYMPNDRLRQTPFYCVRCDKLVNPVLEPWTTSEYLSPKLFYNGVSYHNNQRNKE